MVKSRLPTTLSLQPPAQVAFFQHPATSATGAPAPGGFIPLSVPQFGGREWRYLKECLDTGWVSSAGPFVERFEQAVAAYVGAPYAVAVVNGTAALHTALQVVGVKPNDEVLVSDLTFIAPVNAIRYCQAHPIFVDANPSTWHMDVEKIDRFLTQGCEIRRQTCYNRSTGRPVRAILPVHILGLACEMDRIMELARRFSLRVVEDAAEALGVRHQGRHVGTVGDVGVFSFNGNKIITTGGGGMLVTNDPHAASHARYLTTQAKDDEEEHMHHTVGYNYRLSNIQAALGLAQLEQLDRFITRKRRIARAYEAALRDVDGLTLMPTPPDVEPTYWLYTILLGEGTSLAARQAFVKALAAQGIGARPLWHPIHALAPYRHEQAVEVEHAVRLYERGVSLPSSVGLRDAELQRCVAVVRQLLTTP